MSFCRPIPVNCATTIDLNPVALLPSASIPHIPKTDLKEMLKIYGDAEVTVSDESANVAPVGAGSGIVGAFWTLYWIWLSLGLSDTTNSPLYPATLIPSILNGLSTSKPATAESVVTVIVFVEIIPSPALMLVIPTVPPVDPTIRYSSIFGWISRPLDG